MKTFYQLLNEGRNSLIRINMDDSNLILSLSKSILKLRSFLKRNKDFPNFHKIKSFIDELDTYNNKIFDNWEDYIEIVFKQVNDFIFFDIQPTDDKIYNKTIYKRWYKEITKQIPVIVYFVSAKFEDDPEKVSRFYKIINKFMVNKETHSMENKLQSELESSRFNKDDVDNVLNKFKSKDKSIKKDENIDTTSSKTVDDVLDKYEADSEMSKTKKEPEIKFSPFGDEPINIKELPIVKNILNNQEL